MDIIQENTSNQYLDITNNTVSLVNTVSTIIVQNTTFNFILSLNTNPKVVLQNIPENIFSINRIL